MPSRRNERMVGAGPAGDADAQVVIQPMVSGVAEVIVGASRDPVFGPVVTVGLGGTLTELYQDVSLRLPPLHLDVAQDMLDELKAAPLLRGFRNRPRADEEALVRLIVAVGELCLTEPIEELDLNPVMVHEQGLGCTIVDNRLLLSA